MSNISKPTDSELEILQVLWARNSATVKEVHEELENFKVVGYTTILKLLQIMHEKGLVTRRKNGKSHIYKAILTQEETQLNLVNRLADMAFKGSGKNLIMSALGSGKTSKKEIKEIRKYLDSLDNSEENGDK